MLANPSLNVLCHYLTEKLKSASFALLFVQIEKSSRKDIHIYMIIIIKIYKLFLEARILF